MLSRVQFFVTPWTVAHQVSLSMGFFQARVLEWVAISFSNAWKWKVKVKSLSRVPASATPWTAAYQAPLSMGFFQARVLEWAAIFFSRGSSRPRDRTWVSLIVGRHFTVWTTREVELMNKKCTHLKCSAQWVLTNVYTPMEIPPHQEIEHFYHLKELLPLPPQEIADLLSLTAN